MVKNRTTATRLASEESVLQKNLYQFQKNLYYKIMGGTDDWADWADWAAAKKPPAPTEQPTEGGGGEQSSSAAAPNNEWGGKQWGKQWDKEDWADKSTSKKEDWGGESKDWGAGASAASPKTGTGAPNKEDLRVR